LRKIAYLNVVSKAVSVGAFMLQHNVSFQHVCKQTREHVYLHPIHTFPAITTLISQSTTAIEDMKNLLLIDTHFSLCAF